MTTMTFVPASERQVEFLRKLLGEKVVPDVNRSNIEERLAENAVSKREASQAIDWLLRQPRVPRAANANPVSEPGIYERGGKVYKVQRSKTSGNLYAKVLSHEVGEIQRLTASGETVKAEYVYAPGAFRTLEATDRVTAERAEELSIVYTFCVVCGRTLRAAQSVARGMGPVCASRV